MPRPTIPASVIAQRGVKIKLIDDSEPLVVYTFSSLMRIEEDFGSVQGALVAVRQSTNGKAFTSLCTILAAGLEHEPPTAEGVKLDDDEQLRYMLDPMHFSDYSDAMGEALDRAFPEADDDETAGEGDADPTKDSPGESGTTSQPSPSDEVSSSSGE